VRLRRSSIASQQRVTEGATRGQIPRGKFFWRHRPTGRTALLLLLLLLLLLRRRLRLDLLRLAYAPSRALDARRRC
jgi:hypothetical protein